MLPALLLGACSVVTPAFQAERKQPGDPQPIPVEVQFRGDTGLGELELRRVIEDLMLELSREPHEDAYVFDASIEIEDLLIENGWPQPEVEWEVERPADPEPRVVVIFTIAAGPRVTVADLALVGNEQIDAEDLLPLWRRRASGWFGTGDPYYVDADLRSFAGSVAERYRRDGYLDVTVSEPIMRVLAPDRVSVTLQIREGERYRFGTVSVAPELAAAAEGAMPRSIEGAPAQRATLIDYEDRIRTALRSRGHAFARVTTERTAVAPQAHTVDYAVTGEPGPIATIEEVVIRGNEITSTGVIRSRIPLEPGDRFDGEAIDDALRHLYRLGVFRRIGVTPVPIDDSRERIRLDVHVEESEPRAIELRAGYGSYEAFRGGIRVVDRNLFGLARTLAIEGKLSTKSAGTQATLTNPDFLFDDITLTLGAEWFQREEPSYRDEAVGASAALTRRFGTLSARLGYDYRVRTDPFTDATAPDGVIVDYDEGRLFTELRETDLDNLLFPRDGHEVFVRVETLDPALGASVELWRLRAGWTLMRELGRRWTVGLRGEHGWLWDQEGFARVPLQERWFLGGESSVRSYDKDQLGPKDINGTPLGAEWYNLYTAELRWEFLNNLELAAFVDAGNIGGPAENYGFDEFSFGVGSGIRWMLPIGPLRFDAAINPDPKPGERDYTLHFSVGYPF